MDKVCELQERLAQLHFKLDNMTGGSIWKGGRNKKRHCLRSKRSRTSRTKKRTAREFLHSGRAENGARAKKDVLLAVLYFVRLVRERLLRRQEATGLFPG